MSVCVPLAPKCSTDILLRYTERIILKQLFLNSTGYPKMEKGKNGTLETIATIVSIKNVRLCPHNTKMFYRHIVKGLQKNKFTNKMWDDSIP